MKKILLGMGMLTLTFFSNAQESTDSVDMIIDNYIENIGGVEAWEAVEGVKMSAEVDAQGMTIPIDIYQMMDGRAITKFTYQGMEIVQGAFDGEIMWSTNFMSMAAEKAESEETENKKRTVVAGMNPYINYGDKGYTVEYMGEEAVDGVDCYKIKMTKGQLLVDGEEIDDISYTYFDIETFVPIKEETEVHSGQMKGETAITIYSDYEEVDGLYFAFSITQKSKDSDGQTIEFDEIELNPELDDDFFKFPGEEK